MLSVKSLKRPGLGPVSFDLGDGECLAIVGTSGSGKSLLLRALADLDPNTGDVASATMVRGQAPATEWRKHVALLPAESGWWLDMVGAHFRKLDNVRPRLPAIGLAPEALDWEVARLSSGERHRLALLRCLENDPAVLLLDEPTASLDQKTTTLVEQLVKQQLARGVSVVVVTHDPDQPARIADRTARLENGRLAEVGT